VFGDQGIDPGPHPVLDQLTQPLDLAEAEGGAISRRSRAWSGSSSSTSVRPPRAVPSRRSISASVPGVGSALSMTEETEGSRRMASTSA
jgi:hypothetical protein